MSFTKTGTPAAVLVRRKTLTDCVYIKGAVELGKAKLLDPETLAEVGEELEENLIEAHSKSEARRWMHSVPKVVRE